jgi:hypothetical protein
MFSKFFKFKLLFSQWAIQFLFSSKLLSIIEINDFSISILSIIVFIFSISDSLDNSLLFHSKFINKFSKLIFIKMDDSNFSFNKSLKIFEKSSKLNQN